MNTIPADRLCAMYVRIRSKKEEMQRQHDAAIEDLDKQLQMVKNELKNSMTAQGVTSLKTDSGTAYIQEKTRYYPMDWALFGAWVLKNNGIELLEKRVAQGNMKEWIAANPQNVPPGVQADTELTVTVRKA